MTRRIPLVLLLTALLMVLSLAAASLAAACGTGWESKKEPPDQVLVLRTGSGKVEEVGLKKYVAVVMASGEWPSSLPYALLEAGGHATKQYAWYYALKGNHRDSSKNASGQCYDVRDDSKDQVYSPETAEPTDKQKDARDALWGLSLRKREDFMLTGYRQGSETKCAADADGFHLYATSGKDCAKRLEYDGMRILEAYYSPGLDFVWADGTGPPPDEADDAEDPDGTDDVTADDSSDEDAVADAVEDSVGLLGSVSEWFGSFFSSDSQSEADEA